MINKTLSVVFATAVSLAAGSAFATPADDLKAFRAHFQSLNSSADLADYINGPAAVSADKRLQWEAVEDAFPPYEEYVEKGEELWGTTFKNGKGFASCFGDDASAVRVKYPHWDAKTSKVVTLEGDIVKCMKDNGEKPYKLKKGNIAHLSAYLGYEARGQKINTVISDDPKSIAAYNDGKQFYYGKKGQLNLSCADCHVYSSGQRVRGNTLSPALGHVSHFPVFRGSWAKKTGDGLGTLHRRFWGCMKQVRAHPKKAQGEEFRNMEYFLSSMSNGLEINAPGYRE